MALDTTNGAVFGLISMHSSDPARTRAFYSRVLDWQEFPDGEGDFFMMRRDGSNPEAIIHGAGTSGVPAGQWIPQIAVDDFHAVAATCTEIGGQVIAAIRRVSDEDPGLLCAVRDPEGAVFGLIQVDKG